MSLQGMPYVIIILFHTLEKCNFQLTTKQMQGHHVFFLLEPQSVISCVMGGEMFVHTKQGAQKNNKTLLHIYSKNFV